MRKRLRGISERNWRVIDRVFVAFLILVATVDLVTTSLREGPLALNLAVMTGIALSFAWRRSNPLVTLGCTVAGLLVMAV